MAACTCPKILLAAGVRNEVVARHNDRLVHPGRRCVDAIVSNVSYVMTAEEETSGCLHGSKMYEDLSAVDRMMVYGLDRATCEMIKDVNDRLDAECRCLVLISDPAYYMVLGYLRHMTGSQTYAEKRSKWAYHACRDDQGFFVPAEEDRAREIEEDNRRLASRRAQQH
jgi:hypothetical protein